MLLTKSRSIQAGQRRSFCSLAAPEQKQAEDRFAARIRKCNHLHLARALHIEIQAAGLDSNRYLTNLLIQIYGSLGSLQDADSSFRRMPRRNAYSWNFIIVAYALNEQLRGARSIFDKLPARSDVTWNTMITAYAQNGFLEQAKNLFDDFPVKDLISRNIMITAFAGEGDLQQAKRIFDGIPTEELNAVCWNNILSAYAHNDRLVEAKAIFDGMTTERNPASWNSIISAYIRHGQSGAAIHLFRLMKLDGIRPNRITFACVAEACACAGVKSVTEGRSLLACLGDIDQQDPGVDLNGFVVMFIKCGSFDDAKAVYDKLDEPSAIASTCMVSAYAHDDRLPEAREIFRAMAGRDVVSWTTMIAACCLSAGRIDEGEKLFGLMPARDAPAWSTMLLGFATGGNLQRARELHRESPCRDLSSWTVLISGHAQAGHGKEALEIFKFMDLEGIEADKHTFVSALDACASSGALIAGRSILRDVVDLCFSSDVFVGTALVNMFGKCGRLAEAREIFDSIEDPSIVSWTTIIVAYARCGERRSAAEMFRFMELRGEKSNWVTFSIVLAACSHGGLLEDARDYFLTMIGDHSIAPVAEHYRCLIDLLGRSGQLDKMEDLVSSMPFQGDEIAWTAFLNACRLHGDADRGTRAARQALNVERGSAIFMLLANLYTTTSDYGREASI